MTSIDFLPNIGGVTQHIVEVARALLAGGDTVEVIAPAHSERWGDLQKEPFAEVAGGLPVWRIPYVVNRSVRFLTGQISSRMSERRFKRCLVERLQSWKPDVVHWHALEARHHPMIGWADSARVWTNHTSNFIVGLTSSRREQYRQEAQQADEIICPSEELRELTLSLGIAGERVHFIPNGVDCARFRSDVDTTKWRERLRLNGHERLVLCPRRLERKNGVSFFVRAAIELLRTGTKDVRFALAGNFHGPRADSEEELVSQLIADSGFTDHFFALGRVENTDMPGLYACSDLVVMPSLMEATSLSAMEAMAARKAIVSTNVGGLPFLVRDGENGLLVPPSDAPSLARAMRQLLEAPAKAAEFGANGRARVERELDWSAIAQSTREIYRSAMRRFEERRTVPHASVSQEAPAR